MKNFSSSIQRRKRGKRTEYLARLTYYDKTGKRKGVSKSAATHWDAKRDLQYLIDQHVTGGAEVLEARNMTFAALAEHCKETRYCEAFYDEQGRKLYGVREPKNFASMINRLVSFLGHLKLSDITVSHLQQYRRKRLSTKTRRGTYTDVATVNRELSTCRAMLNDAVTNDWLVRSPFVKAKKGELIAIAHEAKRQVVLSSEDEKNNRRAGLQNDLRTETESLQKLNHTLPLKLDPQGMTGKETALPEFNEKELDQLETNARILRDPNLLQTAYRQPVLDLIPCRGFLCYGYHSHEVMAL